MDLSAVSGSAPFVAAAGIEAETNGDGRCESSLPLREQHLEHDGVVHAGVLATVADHSAGAAAASLPRPGEIVLTTEFEISLLRAARGDRLRCSEGMIKSGSRVTLAEAAVRCESGDRSVPVARAPISLAVLPATAQAVTKE